VTCRWRPQFGVHAFAIFGLLSIGGCDAPVRESVTIHVSEFSLRERVQSALPPRVALADGPTVGPLVFELTIDTSSGQVLSAVQLADQEQVAQPKVKLSLEDLRFQVADMTTKGFMVGRLTFYPVRTTDGVTMLRNPVLPKLGQQVPVADRPPPANR